MAREFRHLGKAAPRMASLDFVTGKAKYARDEKRSGMLCGKILRSPYPHANVTSIDTIKAETYPGVRVVLTYKNAPDWVFGSPIPHVRVLDSKVRYVGDAVALVAADTEEIAEEALDLIQVEYEQLPAVYDIEEAMKPDAPLLYPDLTSNIMPNKLYAEMEHNIMELDIGDTEKGFKEADIIVEGNTSIENAQNPLPPESPGIIAEWEEGKLTVRGSMSSLGLALLGVEAAMGLPAGGLRLIANYVGGSYGSKHIAGNNHMLFYAAALSRAARAPVSLFYTKEEHFTSFQVRMSGRAHYKVGMKKDGTVTAITGNWLANCGSCSSLQGYMASVGLIAFPILARCGNVKATPTLVLTNAMPSGAYRGFGYLENTALLSPVLSMAMEKADLDPVEYYKKNCIKVGDKFYHTYMSSGWEVSAGPEMTATIDKGAEKFGWKNKWKGWGVPTSVNGPRIRAVGIGVAGQSDCGEQHSTVHVQLNAFGSVTVYCCVTEFGTGTRDVMRKIAAEALNMSLESVNLTPPDTAANPWEWGSTGSRSTYAIGSAVLAAAEDAKKQLIARAAPVFGVPPEEVEVKDGWISVKGQIGRTFPWIVVTGFDGSITGIGQFPGRYNIPIYQIQFVEVEVDTETGEVELLNLLSATDCGQIIDPLTFQGQLQGFHPGVDLALREETVIDKASGRMLNPSMIDYKWRVFSELPNHEFVVTETPPNADPPCPFGAFGAGEPSLAPAIPAIDMAIYNAIGKRFFEYPITPDKILKALGKI